MHEPVLDAVLLQFVEVHGTEVSIRLSPLEHVVGDDQDRVPQSNEGTFLAPSGSNAPILCRQVGLLGFRRDMGDFNQGLPEPATPFAGLTAQAFPVGSKYWNALFP